MYKWLTSLFTRTKATTQQVKQNPYQIYNEVELRDKFNYENEVNPNRRSVWVSISKDFVGVILSIVAYDDGALYRERTRLERKNKFSIEYEVVIRQNLLEKVKDQLRELSKINYDRGSSSFEVAVTMFTPEEMNAVTCIPLHSWANTYGSVLGVSEYDYGYAGAINAVFKVKI